MAEPQGISVPIRPNPRGGLALVKGDDYIREIVLRAVSPNYSEHPFEVLFMEEATVFAVDSPAMRAQAVDSISKVFAYLEGRGIARLQNGASGSVSFSSTPGTGELTITIEYLDLKTQDPAVVTRTLRPRATGV